MDDNECCYELRMQCATKSNHKIQEININKTRTCSSRAQLSNSNYTRHLITPRTDHPKETLDANVIKICSIATKSINNTETQTITACNCIQSHKPCIHTHDCSPRSYTGKFYLKSPEVKFDSSFF